MEEVAGPVVAIGLVLSAVFLPRSSSRHHRQALPAVRVTIAISMYDLGLRGLIAQPASRH